MESCFQTYQEREMAPRWTDCLFWFPARNWFEKLLAVPKLPSNADAAMTKAIIQIIQEWKLEDRVKALSFDTTASNTGIHSGCCQLLGEALGRPLLHLACRYHIMELILQLSSKLRWPHHPDQICHFSNVFVNNGLSFQRMESL